MIGVEKSRLKLTSAKVEVEAELDKIHIHVKPSNSED